MAKHAGGSTSTPNQHLRHDLGEEDQGDGCHPCLLVGDASQDGIESQKIPLGHDVRWGGEWVGVDRVVWVAKGDGGSESIQGETDGGEHPAHKVFDERIGEKGALVHRVGANEGMV